MPTSPNYVPTYPEYDNPGAEIPKVSSQSGCHRPKGRSSARSHLWPDHSPPGKRLVRNTAQWQKMTTRNVMSKLNWSPKSKIKTKLSETESTNATILIMIQLISMYVMKILTCPTVNIWGSYQLSVSVSMNEYHLHPYQLIGDNYHPSWINH